MRLSLIIPTYNEVGRIEPSLRAAFRYFESVPYDVEILVVDDGSTDDTLRVVQEVFRTMPVMKNLTGRTIALGANLGKGATVRRGMLEALGDVRIFTDADFSTPIYEVAKILPEIASGTYDIVFGSRAAQNRSLVKKHQPWYREAMGRVYNVFVQELVFRGIQDTQCGFKGFSARAAEDLFAQQKIMGFSFDVEILYLAKQRGYRLKEVAIEWYNDERTTVGAVKDSANMILELLKIRGLHPKKKG